MALEETISAVKSEAIDLAALGDVSFTLGFRLAGLNVVTVTPEEYEPMMETLLEHPTLKILIVKDTDLNNLNSALRKQVLETPEPIIIPLGKESGEQLRERIKIVVGVDIFA